MGCTHSKRRTTNRTSPAAAAAHPSSKSTPPPPAIDVVDNPTTIVVPTKPSVDEQCSFAVENIDDRSQVQSRGQMSVASGQLSFSVGAETDAIHWPVNAIRRYGYDDDRFSFESGRRCSTGQGMLYPGCRIKMDVMKIGSEQFGYQSTRMIRVGSAGLTKPLFFVSNKFGSDKRPPMTDRPSQTVETLNKNNEIAFAKILHLHSGSGKM